MSTEIQNVKIRIVGEADLSQLDKELNKLSKAELDVRDSLKAVDTQAQKTTQTLQNETQKASKAVGESSKSFDGLLGKVKGLSSQIPGAFAVEQILSFGAATKGAVGGIGSMSSALGVLKGALISTGIGALVVALGSLIAYFTRTDDGATKLAGIMGALGAIVNEITGFVAEFGGSVFEAFESVENFEQALSDLGGVIVENVINRFKSVLVYAEALGLLFDGEFAAATKKATDGFIQMNTGIADGTDKLSNFGKKIGEAATQAYNYALQMDAIDDAQRELNVTTAQNEQTITKLIIQSKNRTLSEKERIALIDQASELERANLKAQLELENKRLVLIQGRNETEKNAINQRLNSALKEAKTEEERIELRKKALSISDDLADEEAKQREKIINLQTSSFNLEEKLQNRRDLLVEEGIQKRFNLLKKSIIDEENLEKQKFIDREIDEKQLQDNLIKIQIEGLQRQREFLIANGKDYTEIDKAIQDILIKQRIDADKAKLKADEDAFKEGFEKIKRGISQEENLEKQRFINKETTEEELQDNIANIQLNGLKKERDFLISNGKDVTDIDKAIQDNLVKQRQDGYKQDQKNLQDAEKNKQAIMQASVQLATTIVNGFFDLQKANYNNDLQALKAQQDSQLQMVGDNKQAQSVINKKFAQKELELKRKQAEIDKAQALFTIAISTAQAIAKANPVVPLMILAAALGAAQAAFVAAKPLPKFNRGTKSVPGVDTGGDSIMAMLRPGEGVMPVDRMADYRPAFNAMFDRKVPADFINSIVMDYDRMGRMIPVQGGNSSGLERQLKDMNKKLDKLQVLEVNMDAKGFKTYLKSELSKTELENNYMRIRK